MCVKCIFVSGVGRCEVEVRLWEIMFLVDEVIELYFCVFCGWFMIWD